jgi:hypothetical protein
MKTKLRPSLLLLAFFVTLFTLNAHAQTASANAQQLAGSLSTLPESEIVVYINPSRIINDAMPRLVPEKELQNMRSGIESLKTFMNIDLRSMEFMVIALRFNKPAAGKMFPLPEAMFAARGDFDAKAFLASANAMSDKKLSEQVFGEHTIYLLKLEDISMSAAKSPFGASFSEIGITTLDANTIAVGSMSYIKAALEAADGRGARIKSERLASLLREPNALISMTGSPFSAFAKSFGLRMAENRDPNCMTQFGDFYVALNMDEQNFKLAGAMNADNPDTANMMKGMLSGLLQQTKGSVPDKNAQTMFEQVKLFAEGSEVMIEAIIPQAMAAKFIGDIFAPKKKAEGQSTSPNAPVEKTTTTKPQPTTKKPRRGN